MHFRQRSNRFHVVIGQTVTRIDLQAEAGGVGGRFGNTFQLLRLLGVGFSIGIAAGVDFDIGRANVRCRFDLRFIRIDKQGDQMPASAVR